MRGLLQLFAAYGGFLAFVLLEGISLVLIVQFNHRQKEIFDNSLGLAIAAAERKIDYVTEYYGLKEEVIKLQAKNIRLMEEADNARYNTSVFRDSMRPDSTEPMFTFIGANVVSNSIISDNNSLRLDKGKLDSVQSHMGVISDDGIVGIVRETTGHFCRVMSILHSQSRIKASIKGSDYFGTLTWKGGDPMRMQLEAVPKHAVVKKGDIVQTSGYSQVFPKGILIGKVESARIEPGDNFYTITVKLFNDLSKVQYVYIIDNLMRKEHEELDRAGE
ncbi:MAG: rod shape-determining protein MreC [Phaeodactylibacter sp.]|nr:rod shape-determining protein MreC [Phaeodactylibacter sp.]MCB9301866.1 rod shape-determining protein MreC [Lewinellaceae bacterium]HQU58082.1 rod shape-determining protein MreC [Saprospiraceae bacterium]